MSRQLEAPGQRLLGLWRRMERWPWGQALFSRVLGRMVPYSGALGARVRALEPGRVQVALAERRRVRNHLGSVHAVALVNLGELATGLAVLTALPPGVRGIVTRLDTTFHRKARGRLVARADWSPDEPLDLPGEAVCRAEITDAAGELVAAVEATWRLGEAAP